MNHRAALTTSDSARRPHAGCGGRPAALGLRVALALGALALPIGGAESKVPFRIGITSSMFSDINGNDAKAAIKVWSQVIAREHDVSTTTEVEVFEDRDSLLRTLKAEQLDAVALVLPEFAHLHRRVNFDPVFLAATAGRVTEQYVVLAHRDGAVKSLADLRGRTLLLHENPRCSVAPQWLETQLAEQGLPPLTRLTREAPRLTKLSKVVLPVFFRQADACLVTRRGFETMCELNPQLRKLLSVLVESPEVVPAVFALRDGYRPPFRDRLLAGLQGVEQTPAGRQVLTIFQCDEFVDQPISRLDSALAILDRHARLGAREAGTNGAPTTGSPAESTDQRGRTP